MRSVTEIISTHTVREGGGFKVRRPSRMNRVLSPFLLIDEMGPVDYGPGEAVGAPWHPHRGFETVTYLLNGRMRHEDSAGNSGELNPGDVQWMTAGRGIIHSEEPHEEFKKTGGEMHGFQIWVNLPAKNKMMAPRYQEISAQESPTIEKNGVWARVIAGECMGISSSIDTVIPITLIHVKMQKGTQLIQHLDPYLNSMIYVFAGNVSIPRETSVKTQPQVFGLGVKQSINDGELGLFSEGEKIVINSNMSSEFLILAGPELNEPIARYGPFVMNTREEIQQAFFDYQNGTLGN
ncbi:MAG: pirin [Euryarchaeota archaeon]|mgnify:FL=1|jgi:redox-sensitive bicupin YhaK (pirin superfamily)|nr:pirin [Euryarchaeota archaeon]|tara:strand:+ start:1108 stop:1986 length:879 start_codon:yes stop_codon:yes gene_type:complete